MRILSVRPATVSDAAEAARLLHDFNTEFDDFTPGVPALTERLAELIAADEATVLLGGERPYGIAVLRFRAAIWTSGLDAYLEELYVAPERRGQGLGRALLEAAMEAARAAGALRMDLGTAETDTAARGLYESAGFTNLEGADDGPLMMCYERDL